MSVSREDDMSIKTSGMLHVDLKQEEEACKEHRPLFPTMGSEKRYSDEMIFWNTSFAVLLEIQTVRSPEKSHKTNSV